MIDEPDAQPYVHRLLSGLPDRDKASTLNAEDKREIADRLRNISEAQAEAAIESRDYLIR